MKHPRLLTTVFCLLLALPTLTLTAQDTGWPVETRCIGEPTAPPEGWTFPGAILMTGNFGIHAVQAGWETPHVAAFFDVYETGIHVYSTLTAYQEYDDDTPLFSDEG